MREKINKIPFNIKNVLLYSILGTVALLMLTWAIEVFISAAYCINMAYVTYTFINPKEETTSPTEFLQKATQPDKYPIYLAVISAILSTHFFQVTSLAFLIFNLPLAAYSLYSEIKSEGVSFKITSSPKKLSIATLLATTAISLASVLSSGLKFTVLNQTAIFITMLCTPAVSLAVNTLHILNCCYLLNYLLNQIPKLRLQHGYTARRSSSFSREENRSTSSDIVKSLNNVLSILQATLPSSMS